MPLPELRPLWNFSDPAASEDLFRGMLADHPAADDQAELLTQVARTLGLRRRFEEAHQVLDQVSSGLDNLSPRVRGWYWIERGRAFNSSGERDKAREAFLQSFDLAKAAGDSFLAVDAAHMMGIVEPSESSLEWNEKAIEMARASEHAGTQNWLGSLYNNTGWTYHDLGNHDRALELFEDALEFRKLQGQAENIKIARWAVARCLRSLGRIEEALGLQYELEREQPGGGYTNEEIGECLLALERAEEAAPHFARAYEELSQDDWLKSNEADRLERLKRLGAGAS